MKQGLSTGKKILRRLRHVFAGAVLGVAAGVIGIGPPSAPPEEDRSTAPANDNTDPCKDPSKSLSFVFEAVTGPTILGQKTHGVFADDASGILGKWYGMLGRHHMLMQNPVNASSFNAWLSQLDVHRGKSIAEKAKAVDTLVDKAITYTSDEKLYGKDRDDYWAAPAETVARLKGDCEDMAFLKYFALRYLDVPADRMYNLFVNYREDPKDEKSKMLGHLVLVVDINEKAGTRPHFVILDNEGGALVEEKDRKKYIAYHVMNEQGVWLFPDRTPGMWKPGPPTPRKCISAPSPPPVPPGRLKI